MIIRKVKSYIWADPEDCDPPHGLDMQSSHDAEKVAFLKEEFIKNGFDLDKPALIGYICDGRIQLLSGTHRHKAAQEAKIKLPISIWLKSNIEEMWGTPLWEEVIKDIPVKQLEEFPIEEGHKISPYDRIDLNIIFED